MDRSEEMIAQARQKFPTLHFEVLDVTELRVKLQQDARSRSDSARQADGASKIAKEDRTEEAGEVRSLRFDAVFSNAVLHWIPEAEEVIDRPTALEEGERGLENWIRVFRRTFVEKMGEANAERWIREVERQCRSQHFRDGTWVLDYRRLRIAAWKA